MKTNSIRWALAVALLAGCQYPGKKVPSFTPSRAPESLELTEVQLTNRLDQGWLQPSTELFTLGPGDKLDIELLGEAASKVTTVVAPDGRTYFNLSPGWNGWALTLGKAKPNLEAQLSRYVKDQPK